MSMFRRLELAWLVLCAISGLLADWPSAILAAIAGVAALETMKVM